MLGIVSVVSFGFFALDAAGKHNEMACFLLGSHLVGAALLSLFVFLRCTVFWLIHSVNWFGATLFQFGVKWRVLWLCKAGRKLIDFRDCLVFYDTRYFP